MADKTIRQTSALIDALSVDLDMIEALMDGTNAMRLGGEKWLPRWPKESEETYDARLSTAVLHPVFKRTVLVNAARPFSKPITLGDSTPQQIKDWADDLDLQGTSLAAFAVQIMAACLAKGWTGVLAEYPKADAIRTQADEKNAGVRPYCVHYPANSILGWKTAKGSDGLQLSQLRLLENVEVDAGDFATKIIEQVRLLTPGKWQTFRQDAQDQTKWVEFESGTTTIDFIPFVFFYGIRKSFGVGLSPLRDLAYQNVEHWQSSSDQQTILHVARVPILFAKCFDEGTLTVGAGSAATADNEKSDLKYVEHSGAAIGAGKESLDDLQDRMRTTGAELISLQPGLATATQVSSDNEATESLMQQIVEVFEESLEECLEFMAAWVNLDYDPEVEIYKDFCVGTTSDAGTLGSAVGTKTISKQTHFDELKRRDVLSLDLTWEEEQKRLASEAAQQTKDEATHAKALDAAVPQKPPKKKAAS